MRKTIILPLLLSLAACGQSESDMLGAAREALAQQDLQTARIRLISAVKEDPRNAALLDLLAEVQLRLGDGTSARDTLNRLAAAGGKGLRFEQLTAEMLLLTGRPQDALKRLGQDSSPESLRIGAAALLALDDIERAVPLWEYGTARGVGRDGLRLAFDCGSYLAGSGDLAKARALHGQMTAADPEAFETRMLAARIALESGDAAGARDSYAIAIKAFPRRIEPICGQAEAYDMAGALKEGLDLLAEAEARMPGEPCVTEVRVSLLSQMGEWGKIRDLLQNSEANLNPASGLGMSYAEAVMRLGRPELARAMFNRALAISPQNPYARLMLSEAQLATGDAAAAYATVAPLARSVLAGEQELDLGRRAAAAAGSPDAAGYAARLAKLEFEERTGKLLNADEVKVKHFNLARLLRDRIQQIPRKVAPQIVAAVVAGVMVMRPRTARRSRSSRPRTPRCGSSARRRSGWSRGWRRPRARARRRGWRGRAGAPAACRGRRSG